MNLMTDFPHFFEFSKLKNEAFRRCIPLESKFLLKIDLISYPTLNFQHGKVRICGNYKFKKWRDICHDIQGD